MLKHNASACPCYFPAAAIGLARRIQQLKHAFSRSQTALQVDAHTDDALQRRTQHHIAAMKERKLPTVDSSVRDCWVAR